MLVLITLRNSDFSDGEDWELVTSGTRGCMGNEQEDLEVCVQLQRTAHMTGALPRMGISSLGRIGRYGEQGELPFM